MSSQNFPLFGGLSGSGLDSRRSVWEKLHLDLPLLCALAVLTGFGLMVLYSAVDGNPQSMRRQIVFICLAVVAMLTVAQVEVRVMRRWAPWLFMAGLGLLVAVLFFGMRANGAQRWLDLPGLPPFQPSEMMKILVPMTVAWYLSRRAIPPRLKHVAGALIILGLPAALIQQQPDQGTALLFAVSGIFVLLV
ncbi:MAG: FtsW/RodA/SpoVE family cell cycle protein, partial [Pseudohongiellaceae bacterium]